MNLLRELLESFFASIIIWGIGIGIIILIIYIVNELRKRLGKGKNEYQKFEDGSLNLICEAWAPLGFKSGFLSNMNVFRKYMREAFEAESQNFTESDKKQIEVSLTYIFIKTFAYSYYVLLNLKTYFPKHDTNHLILNLIEVLADMEIFRQDLSDAAKEMIENKQYILTKTMEKLALE